MSFAPKFNSAQNQGAGCHVKPSQKLGFYQFVGTSLSSRRWQTSRILTIIGRHHLGYAEVRRQLFSRPKQNIIVQPANKETGPGILLPLMHIYKRSPEAIVAVFPSDHFIWEEDRFMNHVQLAAESV